MKSCTRQILLSASAVLMTALVITSCKPIDLRYEVIEKIVGLEEVDLNSDTVTNDLSSQLIEWAAIEGASLYRYQWNTVDADGWTETSENSFIPEDEFDEGEHLLHIQVSNADGLWSPIYTFVFTFDSKLTDSPSVTGPDSTDSRRPTWSWSAVDEAEGYSRQLDSTSADGWIAETGLSYTPEADLAIGPHTLYVRAKNDDGDWSGWGYKTIIITEPDSTPDPVDTTAPEVVSHTPGTGEAGPDVSIVITFSEAMDTGSVETAFSLAEGVTPVTGTPSWSDGNTVMTFTPDVPLTVGNTYNYSLDDTVGKDVAGNSLSGGLDSVTITVVDLFNGTPTVIASAGAKPMDLIWDSDNSRFVAICNNDNKFYFYSFSDDTLTPLNSGVISTSLQVKNAVVMRTNSQNSVVWSNQPTGDDTINLTNISDTWSVGSTTPVYTGSHYSSSLSACWNPTDSEIAIVWIDGNTVSFMRVDTSGTILSGPTTVGNATNNKHSSQVFWTGGNNYTVVYAENTSDYKIYLHTISGSSSYVPSSQTGPLTPSEHNVYFRFAAVYTGSELGISWLDSISTHDLDLYFKRFDSDGTATSSKSSILQDFTGNDYVSGFFTEDGMDLQYNGSAYGLVWSQSDDTSSDVGLAETQFCKIEDISGTWKAPTAPIVISQGDGTDGSKEYLTPHLSWTGSRWAAIWKESYASDVYFRE